MIVDYLIKGYSGQDSVQVVAVIQLAVYTVQDRHPDAKKVIIQSDNASGFPSQEIIPLIFNVNTRFYDEKSCVEQIDINRSVDRKNTIGYSLFIYQ